MRDLRRPALDGFDFVAISATRKARPALRIQLADLTDRAGARIAQEHLLLQFIAVAHLLPELMHLLLDECVQFALTADSFASRGMVGVLDRQTVQECADEFRIAVRQRQVRIARVELQRVTFPAMRLEGNLLVICARGVRFVATGTIQFCSVHQRDGG